MSHVKFLVLLLGLLALGACDETVDLDAKHVAEDTGPIELTYTLKPIPDQDGKSVLEITLEFAGDRDGQTELRLGEPWADQRTPHRRFRGLAVDGGEILLRPDSDAHVPAPVYRIKHEPGADLRVTYQLHEQDNPDPLNNAGYFHSPVIRADHMQLIGWSAFAVPYFDASGGERDYSAKAIWADLPERWESMRSPALTGEEETARRSFRASVAFAGDIERTARGIGDEVLTVARYGEWSFTHVAFADQLKVILTALNETWQDDPADYSVTLLPVPVDGSFSTITGTGLIDAFAAAGSEGLGLDEMSGVLTHEIAHNWIPARLGNFPEEGARGVYWFSEGFTEFSARTLMWDKGLMSQETFVEKVNEDLQTYYLSPARNSKVEALIEGFWNDPDIERQPYLRGFLIALGWDAEIHAQSGGASTMGDALRALKAKAEQAEELPTLTPAYLTAHFSEWTGRDVSSDIERHIDAGETLVPSAGDLGACYRVKDTPIAIYDVGFNVAETFTDGIVKGVIAGSTAEEAGLRNGLQLRARVSGGQGDTSGPITLELAEGERVFQISYLPVSGEPVMIPQFKSVEGRVCQ